MNTSFPVLLALASAAAVTLSSCVIEPGAFDTGGGGPPPYDSSYDRPYNPPQSGYYSRPTPRPYYQSQPPPGYYDREYSGYQPRPQPSSNNSEKTSAYNQGYRKGGDDYRAHRSKHMDRHGKLFNSDTHDAFRDGYDAGYDSARRHDNR